jgi:AcrR family transcriptional regulator
MRTLGRALGVEAMSLYNHVANKDDLLDGLIDLVYAEIVVPTVAEPWREAQRRRAVSAREVLLRHPWAIVLMESRARPGPANLAHHEAVVANLLGHGFSARAATRAYNLVDSYVYGFALQEKTLPVASDVDIATVAPEMLRQFGPDEYPHLDALATELIESGFRYADEFEPGLDLILDGLERLAPAASPR